MVRKLHNRRQVASQVVRVAGCRRPFIPFRSLVRGCLVVVQVRFGEEAVSEGQVVASPVVRAAVQWISSGGLWGQCRRR